MKKDLHLIASVDQPEMMENIIEKLATRQYAPAYSSATLPSSWKAINSSSVESYISGRVEFDYNETERIRILYTTSFLFSCAIKKKDEYELFWSVSLS